MSGDSDAGGFDPVQYAVSIGYSRAELASVPEGVVCRGCGNPTALAELRPGETVLDLGSGSGLDAFLAAQRVGSTGRVIGVDASHEAVAKATAHAAAGGYANVVFKAAPMDHVPLEDASIDAAISNCVVNYAADKAATFKELFRCLRPGGRVLVSDLLVEGEFSQGALQDPLWGDWLAHASGKREYLAAIAAAGFREVEVLAEGAFPMTEMDPRLRGRIVSIKLRAQK